jgi:hypothetical protein
MFIQFLHLRLLRHVTGPFLSELQALMYLWLARVGVEEEMAAVAVVVALQFQDRHLPLLPLQLWHSRWESVATLQFGHLVTPVLVVEQQHSYEILLLQL